MICGPVLYFEILHRMFSVFTIFMTIHDLVNMTVETYIIETASSYVITDLTLFVIHCVSILQKVCCNKTLRMSPYSEIGLLLTEVVKIKTETGEMTL